MRLVRIEKIGLIIALLYFLGTMCLGLFMHRGEIVIRYFFTYLVASDTVVGILNIHFYVITWLILSRIIQWFKQRRDIELKMYEDIKWIKLRKQNIIGGLLALAFFAYYLFYISFIDFTYIHFTYFTTSLTMETDAVLVMYNVHLWILTILAIRDIIYVIQRHRDK